jgi:hypothetical protein
MDQAAGFTTKRPVTFDSALRFASVSPCVYTSSVMRLLA